MSVYVGPHAAADPYIALGRLRDKIRKGLSTRYLTVEYGRRLPSHNVLKGHVAYGGVIVDGEFVHFEEFVVMLQTYEGHQFSLHLADPCDAIWPTPGAAQPSTGDGAALAVSWERERLQVGGPHLIRQASETPDYRHPVQWILLIRTL